MEGTPAGCRDDPGAREGEGTAVEGAASGAPHAKRRSDEKTTEAAGGEDAAGDAAQGDTAAADSDKAKAAAPTAGMGAAGSEAVEPEAIPQAVEAAAEEALSDVGKVGTAAARAAPEAVASLDFDPFAEAGLAADEQASYSEADLELPRPEGSDMKRISGKAAPAAKVATGGGAETSAAERKKAAPARMAAATARGEAAADGAHEAREAEAAIVAAMAAGRERAAAGPATELVRARGQSAAAEGQVIATEAAALAGATLIAAQAVPVTVAQRETDLTDQIAVPGDEALAGKEATAVTKEEIAVRERVTLERAGRADEAAGSAVTEEASANKGGGECGIKEESVLRKFRGDVAAIVTEEAFATAEDSADAGEETTAIAKPEGIAPLAGEDAEAFQGCPAAAEVAAGPEGGGSAIEEEREEPEELQCGSAAPAVMSKMTGAFLNQDAGMVRAAVCHSTGAAYAINSEPATAAARTGPAAAASLVSVVGSGTRADTPETATALVGNGSAENAFDGGDPVSAFSLEATAACSMPPETEAAVGRERGVAGEWIAESTALKGEGAPWKAAAAALEVDASGGFAESAENGTSTSFVGVPQQLVGSATSSYNSSSGNINGTFNSRAGGRGCAGLTGSCSGGENSNKHNINSSYGNSDCGGGGSGSSCVDLTGSFGSSISADGSGSSVDLLDNYVRSDCISTADGGRSCTLGRQYYGEGDTQQVCISQNFSGSTGDEGVYSSSCNKGLEYGSSGGSGGYGNSVDCGGSRLAYGSSSAGLETLMIEEMAAETSGSSSSGLAIECVADCSTLPYPGTRSSSADYYGGVISDDSAAVAAIGEDINGEITDICNGIVDAGWRVAAEQEGEQLGDEEELDREKEEDQTETKQPWRGVLGTNDLLTERDNDILQLLADDEPPIPDELCRYFLHRVGCAATDRTVARLVSIAAQLQLERVMDDAKVFAFCMQRGASAGSTEDPVQRHHRSDLTEDAVENNEFLFQGRTPDDVKDLDLGSLCAALQKSDNSFSGLSLDCFLDIAPVFMPSLTGTSSAKPEETSAIIPASPIANPATSAELMVDNGETESRTISGITTSLEATDYAALPYSAAFQSSFPDVQSVPPSIIPPPCDAVGLNATLLLGASHADPLYAASLEEYNLSSTASSVNPASLTAVTRAAAALHSTNAAGEVPTVLSHNNPFLTLSAPVTVDDTYRVIDAPFRDAPAAMSHSGAADVNYRTITEVAAGLSTGTASVNTGVAPDVAVDMGADAAAGVMPACIDNAVPLAGRRSSPNDLVSAPGVSSAAGVMFDPTLSPVGVLHAVPGVGSIPPPVLEGDMSLAAEDVRVAGPSSADAAAGDMRPVPVSMSVGAVGAPAGNVAAEGLSGSDAAHGSVHGAGTPLSLSALNAPAQSPTAIAVSIVPPAAADVAVTYHAAAIEPAAYTPFNATAPGAFIEDVETAHSGTSLLSSFSSASAEAAATDSVTTRSPATFCTEVAAGFANDTTARYSVESAVPSEPVGIPKTSPAETMESTDSTSQRSEPTLQRTATAVREAAATTRETAAMDNEASGTQQSTRNSLDTDVLKKF